MPIRVKLHHETTYNYDRLIGLGPQTVRLRPAPHARTPIVSYSLKVEPAEHFINWQQDPHGNFLARLVFPAPARKLSIAVDLIAEMTVINPFDFFLEDEANEFPFCYAPELAHDLSPFLKRISDSQRVEDYRSRVDLTPRRTMDFLVELNQMLQSDIDYVVRMEPGVQTPEETLQKRIGSCRDSAWLLADLLRGFGLASRFVSGYLIQLTPDVKPLDGPAGPDKDFTDLHAWTEVFLPGAGWVGLDPTSGLLAGEGHIPLAATPDPRGAAPVSGSTGMAEVEFDFAMSVTRVHEDPRVTRPYTDSEWQEIDAAGRAVDEQIAASDMRLTMGGEPTFVSVDNMEGEEWNSAATGLQKQSMSNALIRRLMSRFGKGGLLHYGQGKWYPGESLPRWAYSCIWRTDGEPVWQNPDLLASPFQEEQPAASTASIDDAARFTAELTEQIGVDAECVQPAYEDILHLLEVEQQFPVDVNPADYDLDSDEDRRRLTRALSRGIDRPVGYVLPLTRAWWQARPRWVSQKWKLRSERVLLIPGDSPLGLRLPLNSLPSSALQRTNQYFRDPTDTRDPLPGYAELRRVSRRPTMNTEQRDVSLQMQPRPADSDGASATETAAESPQPVAEAVISTALCIEPRNGRLHVFMPPCGALEDYLDLLATIEATAERTQMPVTIEGYLPPEDDRIQILKVTPDPGVIEVNVQPARNWEELKFITQNVYEAAHETRLGTEKFQADGRHSGTGGGNHLVVGGPTPQDSPFLRHPDLLKSVIAFWNNHPSLSYLFSGLFIGPTSQSPRLDEGRRDSVCEMELAFAEIPDRSQVCPPWLTDRVFRNLLIDLTGNTHRAEICIDKLYSPDQASGRLGLVEFRAFEMPPHARMSLTQQLLVRALLCAFWQNPYEERLIHWRSAIHDRFLMPHFLWRDLEDIVTFLRGRGFSLQSDWFRTHFEFRCPQIGVCKSHDVTMEFRQALEPWYVLGEEPGGGGTTRFVDSSLERIQVRADGLHSDRYCLAVNGIRVPLHETGSPGRRVGAIRYRAWQPPRCLHPTIAEHTPLIFDLVDLQQGISVGGCQYHVEHPGGLNSQALPINALEAESRRAARFFRNGHTGGRMVPQPPVLSEEYPLTLDLRRSAHM